MKEDLVAKLKRNTWRMKIDMKVLGEFLPEIQQVYDIQHPIYKVMFLSDVEGRQHALFAFCAGAKEDIKKLVNHESNLMGPRDEMVLFLESDLHEAAKHWLETMEDFEERIEIRKRYLKGRYPRIDDLIPYSGIKYKVTKEQDERILISLEKWLQFLKETGPVVKVKPASEEQVCPHCLKIFREGKEQKAS